MGIRLTSSADNVQNNSTHAGQEIGATRRRQSQSCHPQVGNSTATCPQKAAQMVPSYQSSATSQRQPELRAGLEEMQNALKDKGNARGLAAAAAFQLSASTRRKELTEKDAHPGLDADLKGGG